MVAAVCIDTVLVVVSAETVNCFKTRLDRFWLNQDIYNFRYEIHGTGSRSEITVISSLE